MINDDDLMELNLFTLNTKY